MYLHIPQWILRHLVKFHTSSNSDIVWFLVLNFLFHGCSNFLRFFFLTFLLHQLKNLTKNIFEVVLRSFWIAKVHRNQLWSDQKWNQFPKAILKIKKNGKKLQALLCELAEQSACEHDGVMAHFTALKEDVSCRGTQRLFLSQTAAPVCHYQPGMQTPNTIFQLFPHTKEWLFNFW